MADEGICGLKSKDFMSNVFWVERKSMFSFDSTFIPMIALILLLLKPEKYAKFLIFTLSLTSKYCVKYIGKILLLPSPSLTKTGDKKGNPILLEDIYEKSAPVSNTTLSCVVK